VREGRPVLAENRKADLVKDVDNSAKHGANLKQAQALLSQFKALAADV